jgi:heptosyltransferase I
MSRHRSYPGGPFPERLCLFRLSAIGDCCNIVPVVRSLQTFLPDTRLTWVMGKTESSLLGDLDGVEVIPYDKRNGTGTLRRQLGARDFDALLLMQVALRAGLTARAVRAPVRIGFDRSRSRDGHGIFINQRIPARPPGHVTEGFFGFCEALGVEERVLRWDIPIPRASVEQVDHWLGLAPGSGRGENAPILVISPCSSERFRNFRDWSAEHYARVAHHAAVTHGMRVVLTGGKSEREREYGERIEYEFGRLGKGLDRVPVPKVNLIGRTSLKTLFALIRRATAVVAPDSGPIHMAVAAGTPALGLYATSNPDRTGPLLGRRWVVNAYPQAVQRFLKRSVDGIPWGKRVRDPDAMALIDPAMVIERLDALMEMPPEERLDK